MSPPSYPDGLRDKTCGWWLANQSSNQVHLWFFSMHLIRCIGNQALTIRCIKCKHFCIDKMFALCQCKPQNQWINLCVDTKRWSWTSSAGCSHQLTGWRDLCRLQWSDHLKTAPQNTPTDCRLFKMGQQRLPLDARLKCRPRPVIERVRSKRNNQDVKKRQDKCQATEARV